MKRNVAWAALVVAWFGWYPSFILGPGQACADDKNHVSVKRAFCEVISQASAGTVRIVVGGKEVALGTVVADDGYIVSKASLIEGKPTCRLKDGRQLEATTVGVDENHDLALLKVTADGLTPVPWCTGNPPPGSIIAAVGTGTEPLAVGVIGTDPRPIAGMTRPRAWLGIVLGEGEGGLEITTVAEDSAAEKAGLKVGDRIVRVDETRMQSYRQVVQYVGGRRPGDTIELLIGRDEKQLELSATLGKPQREWSPRDQWGGGPFSERRWGFPIALPHDAFVQPNDCGGPLVDTSGKVVGINIARALRVTSYAIPADTVKEVVRKLRAKEH